MGEREQTLCMAGRDVTYGDEARMSSLAGIIQGGPKSGNRSTVPLNDMLDVIKNDPRLRSRTNPERLDYKTFRNDLFCRHMCAPRGGTTQDFIAMYSLPVPLGPCFGISFRIGVGEGIMRLMINDFSQVSTYAEACRLFTRDYPRDVESLKRLVPASFFQASPKARYNAQVLFMQDQWLPYLRDAHASAYLSSTVDGPSHLDAVYTPVPASLPDSWSHPSGFNTMQQPSMMQQPSTVQQSLRHKMAFNCSTATQPVQSVQQPMGMPFNSSTGKRPHISAQVVAQVVEVAQVKEHVAEWALAHSSGDLNAAITHVLENFALAPPTPPAPTDRTSPNEKRHCAGVAIPSFNLPGAQVDIEPPDHLCCPLTLTLFDDPISGPDGRTYSRAAITKALALKQESPFTKQKMCTTDLQRNLIVEQLVSDFKKDVSSAQRHTQHQQHSNKTQVTPSDTDFTMFAYLANETKGEASTKDKDRLERLLFHHECNGLAIELSTRAAHTAHHRKIALAVAHMDMIQAKFRAIGDPFANQFIARLDAIKSGLHASTNLDISQPRGATQPRAFMKEFTEAYSTNRGISGESQNKFKAQTAFLQRIANSPANSDFTHRMMEQRAVESAMVQVEHSDEHLHKVVEVVATTTKKYSGATKVAVVWENFRRDVYCHDTGITWELASKFEGKLSFYKVLLDDFVASMLRSSWGKGKTYPFERLPGNKLDKSVISKPGFEWLSNERDSDEGKTDDAQACARANRSRNNKN